MKNEIYLGRLGQAFGPYSEKEYEAFQHSGELKKFSWLWNAESSRWEALDPAPAPLGAQAGRDMPSNVLRHDALLPIEVICHNGISAITVGISNILPEGAELTSLTPLAEIPFPVPSRVILSVLDPVKDQATNISAQILTVTRKEGRWQLSIGWLAIPEMIRNSLAA